MIEERIEALIQALERNTAALIRHGGDAEAEAPAAPKPARAARKTQAKAPAKRRPGRPRKAKPVESDDVNDVDEIDEDEDTKEELRALLKRVSKEVSSQAAKDLLAEFDNARSIGEVDKKDYKALMQACIELLEQPDDEDDERPSPDDDEEIVD